MLERNEMIVRGAQPAPAVLAPYLPPQRFVPPPEPEEPSIVRAIWRHAWIVVLVLGAALGGAYYWLKNTVPLYESTAKLYFESNTISTINGGAVGGVNPNDPVFVSSQQSLLQSTPILARVAEKEEIKNLKTFGDQPPLVFLRDNVSTDIGRRDFWLEVSLRSPHKDEAALIVNTIVDTYIDFTTSQKGQLSGEILKKLQEQRDEIVASIREKQNRLDEMRKLNPNLNFADGANPDIAVYNTLAVQYTDAQLQRMKAESNLAPNNPQVVRAREYEAKVGEQLAEAREKVYKQTGKAIEFKRTEIEMQQEAKLLDPLETRIKEQQLKIDFEKSAVSARIAERGRPAEKQAFPRKSHTYAAAGVLGLVLGCCLALLRDKMDTRLHTVEDIQTVMGLPILGVVPRMPGRRTAVARAMAVHLDPRSQVAEAYRTVRTAVYFGPSSARTKTILVTSPESGDGKTTSASNLAIAIAQTGRSILLLDADFRKPTQHKNLDINDNVGLSSVLAGVAGLDKAIQHTGVEGLDILPCGPIPENPSEILNSREFGDLIDQLAMRYDHILFDSPPVNLVTDARILAAVCDATILVLRADKSTKKSAEHARNALMGVGAHLLGAIVNGVPRGKGYEVYGGSYYGTPEIRTRPVRSGDGSIQRVQRGTPAVEVNEA